MNVYIDPKLMQKEPFSSFEQHFPNVHFIKSEEEAPQADVLVAFPYNINTAKLETYTQLKWLQLLTAGFDTMDLDYLSQRHIQLTNARDIYSKTIAEDVFCKILTINRHVKTYLHQMETKTWKPIAGEPEIADATVGIIGAGSIAKEIAKRMKAFEARVIGFRQSDKPEDYFDAIYTGKHGLNDVFKQSDYVIVALPLNEETRGLIGRDQFNVMKPSAVFINIARGDIIVQQELIEALQNQQLRGAGLDVTSPEPLPQDNPLWSLDSVFLTPHNAPSSPKTINRLAELVKENLTRYLHHEKLLNIIE